MSTGARVSNWDRMPYNLNPLNWRPGHTHTHFLDPFLMKRRSPLDPVSSNTLIVFCLTISLLLTSLTGLLSPFRCLLDQFRSFFFEFSRSFGLISNLELRELLLSPKTLSIATTAVTLPVLEFSIAISLALILSSASLVALIGRVSVDFNWILNQCSRAVLI